MRQPESDEDRPYERLSVLFQSQRGYPPECGEDGRNSGESVHVTDSAAVRQTGLTPDALLLLRMVRSEGGRHPGVGPVPHSGQMQNQSSIPKIYSSSSSAASRRSSRRSSSRSRVLYSSRDRDPFRYRYSSSSS